VNLAWAEKGLARHRVSERWCGASRLACVDPSDHLAGFRESLLLVFAEQELALDVYIEDAPCALDQLRFDCERFTQLLRQADGLAVIVSGLAPDDLDLHRYTPQIASTILPPRDHRCKLH